MADDLFNHLPPDHDDRRLIESELDRTMLVEAAAGTGKTTSLLKRMVRLLAEGRCTVGTMAAVTFTRKATAELRSRFQVAMETELGQATGERRARLQDALEHSEQCLIGTIHSFCGRLLRERPIEAGVDVAFQELDEDADWRLRREAWDEYVARLHATGDPLLALLDELGLELSELKGPYLEFADYPDVEQWPAPPGALDIALADAARRELRAWGTMGEPLVDQPRYRGNDELMPFLRELPQRLRNMTLSRDRELLELLDDCHRVDTIVMRDWPGGTPQGRGMRDRWERFRTTLAAPLIEQWRRTRYPAVIAVLQGAVAVYQDMRAVRGALNYQDLLMKAAGLLRDKPHVRRYFRERFTHLLVDEFQDTDPVQAEVMLLCTADDPAQTDWRKCRPVEGSLFVVGDPRQSIYRFRRADIVTYNQVKEIIARDGRIVTLSANFRSIAPLIRWFGAVSADLFSNPGDYSPPDSPMRAARPGPETGACSGVAALDIPFKVKAESEAHEAETIARSIRDALDRRLSVPRTPEELRRKPPHVTPGDFMILTDHRWPLITYAQRLQHYGIPVEVTGGTAVNEHDEVALLHAVLAAVVEPDNPVVLVGVLRGAVFGISDTALYRFERGGGVFNFHRADAAAEVEGGAAIAEAYARLKTFSRWFSTMQPVAVIERIAVDLGLLARAASGPAGADRAGVLCKAIELLRSAYRELWSPADLVRYLWQLIDPAPGPRERHDGVPLRPHEGEAVRLMNLHQAKGLEAPIVFLAEACGPFQRGVTMHVDRRGGTVVGYLQVRGRKRGEFDPGPLLAAPEDWPRHEAEELRYREAELDRLHYVAATRAAAQLVIGRPTQKQRWDKLLAHVPTGDVLSVPPPVTPPAVPDQVLPPAAPQAFAASVAERWAALARPSWDERRLKEMVVSGGRAARPGEHGTEWGSVIHVLLEAAMGGPGADLGALAASALEEHDLDPARSDEALAQVQAVMASELWARAQASPERLTEVPLQYLEPSAGESAVETIVRGVIDLVFREAGGWVIVDYKTDDRDESTLDALVEHYAPQVRAYAQAWSRLSDEPVIETGLFLVNTGRYREVPPGPVSAVGA